MKLSPLPVLLLHVFSFPATVSWTEHCQFSRKCNGTLPKITDSTILPVPVASVDSANINVTVLCVIDFKCEDYAVGSTHTINILPGNNTCVDGKVHGIGRDGISRPPNIKGFVKNFTLPLTAPEKYQFSCGLHVSNCPCNDSDIIQTSSAEFIVSEKPLDIVVFPPSDVVVNFTTESVYHFSTVVKTVEGYAQNVSLQLTHTGDILSNVNVLSHIGTILNSTHVKFTARVSSISIATYITVPMKWSFLLFGENYKSSGTTEVTTFLHFPPTPWTTDKPSNSAVTVALSVVLPFVAILLILLVIFFIGCLYCLRWRYMNRDRVYYTTLSDVASLLRKVEIEFSQTGILYPGDSLEVTGTLGEGAFGLVKRGVLRKDKLTTEDVAVKMLRGTPNYTDMKEFIDEFRILSRLDKHKNIISLIGGVICNENFLILVEFASRGSLLSLLKQSSWQRNTLTWPTRLDYALQVARGMAYLAKMQYIHCDLAARNVLVSEDGTMKVSDFGLARKLYYSVYQKKVNSKTRLPIKWMALESLQGCAFSSQSDVWAFGVLMWEMATLGCVPYMGIPPRDVPTKLNSGYRMERPVGCPETIYTIMRSCWLPKPEERPTFSQLVALLEMLKGDSDMPTDELHHDYYSYQNYKQPNYGVDYTIYCCQQCHYEYDIFNDEEQVMNPKVFDSESDSECFSCPYCGHQLNEGSETGYHNMDNVPQSLVSGNASKTPATRLVSADSYVCHNFSNSTSTESCYSEHSCELSSAPVTQWRVNTTQRVQVIPVSQGRTRNVNTIETDL